MDFALLPIPHHTVPGQIPKGTLRFPALLLHFVEAKNGSKVRKRFIVGNWMDYWLTWHWWAIFRRVRCPSIRFSCCLEIRVGGTSSWKDWGTKTAGTEQFFTFYVWGQFHLHDALCARDLGVLKINFSHTWSFKRKIAIIGRSLLWFHRTHLQHLRWYWPHWRHNNLLNCFYPLSFLHC